MLDLLLIILIFFSTSAAAKLNEKIFKAKTANGKWLMANEIALYVSKTGLVIFWSPTEQITKKMNFRLSGQKVRQKTCTKYIGLLLDEYLFNKDDINTLKEKLNSAWYSDGILPKLRLLIS